MQWLRWLCLIAVVAWSPGVLAHPHDEDTIVVLTGTLTRVDLDRRTVELDVYDRQAKQTRNLLLFLAPKVKLTQGKQRLTLADIGPGQRVVCVAERQIDQGSRLVAFEIRVTERSK